MDRRFTEQSQEIDRRFTEQSQEMDRRFAEQKNEMDRRFSLVDQRFDQMLAAIERLSDKLDLRGERQRRFTLQMFSISVAISVLGVTLQPSAAKSISPWCAPAWPLSLILACGPRGDNPSTVRCRPYTPGPERENPPSGPPARRTGPGPRTRPDRSASSPRDNDAQTRWTGPAGRPGRLPSEPAGFPGWSARKIQCAQSIGRR